MRIFLDLATCHTPQAHSRIKAMCHGRPFTWGTGEILVWWVVCVTGVAGCCHKGKSLGSSLGFIIIHVPPRTSLGHLLSACWETMASGPVGLSPLGMFIAWEVGVKAGSPSGLGLMIPQARLCINKTQDWLLRKVWITLSPFFVSGLHCWQNKEHRSHEYGRFWEILLPPFKALG